MKIGVFKTMTERQRRIRAEKAVNQRWVRTRASSKLMREASAIGRIAATARWGKRLWTKAEDALIRNSHDSDEQLSQRMGRTVAAIRKRRWRLTGRS